MKRLFPAPWLSLALWLLWLVLNLSLSPGNLLLGALLGMMTPRNTLAQPPVQAARVPSNEFDG